MRRDNLIYFNLENDGKIELRERPEYLRVKSDGMRARMPLQRSKELP